MADLDQHAERASLLAGAAVELQRIGWTLEEFTDAIDDMLRTPTGHVELLEILERHAAGGLQ